MDLLAYFRIIWRRWVLIVVLTVLGAALGVGSTLFDESSASNSKARTSYKATNTLVFDSRRGQQGRIPARVQQPRSDRGAHDHR